MGGYVQQSGNATPGHLAKWITSGVIADAGPQIASQRVLAVLQGADFNSVQDQPLNIPNTITAFQLTGIIITNASISLTTAAGGFYPQFSKAGSAIVAAGQVYSSLTTANLLLNATLTAFALSARFSTALLPTSQIIFSLTTPQGAAATADIYAVGIDLSIGS
jgi:hypothetical protein